MMKRIRLICPAGALEGGLDPDTGVASFKGVPFAAAPLGPLRWKPPEPHPGWQGVREATVFGMKPMQNRLWDDMVSRAPGMSEDCLALNIWSPSPAAGSRLPVLVYFFGGGFMAGDASEPRYDGVNMARRGMVVVTVN